MWHITEWRFEWWLCGTTLLLADVDAEYQQITGDAAKQPNCANENVSAWTVHDDRYFDSLANEC